MQKLIQPNIQEMGANPNIIIGHVFEEYSCMSAACILKTCVNYEKFFLTKLSEITLHRQGIVSCSLYFIPRRQRFCLGAGILVDVDQKACNGFSETNATVSLTLCLLFLMPNKIPAA